MGMLNGLLAVVTGAGQGIGQGIAEHLASEGASLALMGRTAKSLKETVARVEAAGAAAV